MDENTGDTLDNRSKDAGSSSSGDGKRVIEIGWQVILLPVALGLVVWVGWQAGRLIARGNQPEQVAVVTGNLNVPPVVQDGPIKIDLTGGGAQQFAQPTRDMTAIYPLPERFHPLKDKPAPDFTMRLLGTEEEVSLSDFKGQPVLINFWATWCPPCRAEMPWIESLHQKYKDDGLVVLAVDAGEKVPPTMVEETVQRYINGSQLTFPVLMGENTYEVQRAYSVFGLPGTVLVTPEGNIAEFHSGMYPNEATLEDRIRVIMPDLDPLGPGGQG